MNDTNHMNAGQHLIYGRTMSVIGPGCEAEMPMEMTLGWSPAAVGNMGVLTNGDWLFHEYLQYLAQHCGMETARHLDRVESYTRILANTVCRLGLFPKLSPFRAELIARASPLHDLGKIGLPPAILFKPDSLTAEERIIVQTHVHVGVKIMEPLLQRSPESLFLKLTREIVLTHHERNDGGGYPQGLIGEEIPLSGRIVALIDVYDALTSRRIYKDALPHDDAVVWLTQTRRQEFDPQVIAGFLACADAIQSAGSRLHDYD